MWVNRNVLMWLDIKLKSVRIIHLKQDFTGELSVERVQIVGIVLRDQVPVVVEANGRGRIVAAFVREFGVLEQRVHHVDCELEFVMFEISPDQIRIIRCDWSGDTPESCCCRRVRESTPSCPWRRLAPESRRRNPPGLNNSRPKILSKSNTFDLSKSRSFRISFLRASSSGGTYFAKLQILKNSNNSTCRPV